MASHGQAQEQCRLVHTHPFTHAPQRSPSLSRRVLVLRSFLGHFSAPGHARSCEEPFIPVDPLPAARSHLTQLVRAPPLNASVACRRGSGAIRSGRRWVFLHGPGTVRYMYVHMEMRIYMLTLDTLPCQLYLHSQLLLSSLYFSRVALIFEDAAVLRP
ncbi:hypothetical protein BGY98DRAFT_969504, partial [Russula aff. rugulosa BPL654]